MSQKIITLSSELANQIAAGEVVERPISIVKELVENSIDAGATSIRVRLENGGIDLIEVSDDGLGIWEQDLPKALEKYSTSKITSLKDLQEVMTFGFRGEALASISSVSKFEIISSTDGKTWKSLSNENSKTINLWKLPHERGTTIRVKDLFYNTPARLNYLKTPRTEYLKIQEYIQKIALSYPELELRLEHDGKETQHFLKNQDLKARIYEIYGDDFSKYILPLEHEFWGIRISGIISSPKISFQNKNKQHIFVNKRIVQSPIISKAVIDAYNRYIAPRTLPGYILHIDLDPTQVDVNVHPRKMEVRFAWEQNLFRSVYHGIKNLLEGVSLVSSEPWIPSIDSRWINVDERKETIKYHTSSGTKFKNYSPYTDTTPNPSQWAIDFSKAVLWKSLHSSFSWKEKGEWAVTWERWVRETGDLRSTPLWTIIGQVHNAYIIIETPNGVEILDQHAVAERVIYEKLASSSYVPKSQQILWGVSFKLGSSERELFEGFREVFDDMGFDIEILSHSLISIQAIPDFVGKVNIEKIFRSVLTDISSVGSKTLDEERHKIWAYTACRSAVKFWDPLSIFEMHALLRDASLDYSTTCPHGRPVVYEIDLSDLQKKYER